MLTKGRENRGREEGRIEIGGWRLGIGDWRLGVGDWRLLVVRCQFKNTWQIEKLSLSLVKIFQKGFTLWSEKWWTYKKEYLKKGKENAAEI